MLAKCSLIKNWLKPRLELPIMQAHKYGETSHMVKNQIFGH
jgi:hypothetical protein